MIFPAINLHLVGGFSGSPLTTRGYLYLLDLCQKGPFNIVRIPVGTPKSCTNGKISKSQLSLPRSRDTGSIFWGGYRFNMFNDYKRESTVKTNNLNHDCKHLWAERSVLQCKDSLFHQVIASATVPWSKPCARCQDLLIHRSIWSGAVATSPVKIWM